MTATSPLEAAAIPTPNALSIRPETPHDADWVDALHEVSFGPGRFARAAYRVREQIGVDPAFSYIAEVGGERAASVRMTPISIGGTTGYLLGPLMTDPQFRKQGAGRALVKHVCDLALARPDVAYVVLVGDFAYYGPLGFVRTVPDFIVFPGPVDPARILIYTPDAALSEHLAGEVAPWA